MYMRLMKTRLYDKMCCRYMWNIGHVAPMSDRYLPYVQYIFSKAQCGIGHVCYEYRKDGDRRGGLFVFDVSLF